MRLNAHCAVLITRPFGEKLRNPISSQQSDGKWRCHAHARRNVDYSSAHHTIGLQKWLHIHPLKLSETQNLTISKQGKNQNSRHKLNKSDGINGQNANWSGSEEERERGSLISSSLLLPRGLKARYVVFSHRRPAPFLLRAARKRCGEARPFRGNYRVRMVAVVAPSVC